MRFTAEQLKAAEDGKNFAWDARTIPSEFDPVQLETGPSASTVFDWWSSRGTSLCCFFPFLRCLSGNEKVDAKDLTHWKKQLASPSNKDCPESMQGLWWMKYNYAPENLVTIFGDCEWTGTFNKEGTDGFGVWTRRLRHNWSRENSLLGLLFTLFGKADWSTGGRMNLKDGICTIHGVRGEGNEVVYRVNDNEWWKIHYRGGPGEDGENDIEWMYKWLKVVDADGKPTEHWDEWQDWVDAPLPHQGCGCGEYKSCFWPFWGSCLSGKQVRHNMIMPNKTQVVNFRV